MQRHLDEAEERYDVVVQVLLTEFIDRIFDNGLIDLPLKTWLGRQFFAPKV